MKAKKIGRNWFTTHAWVREYLAKQVYSSVFDLSKKGFLIRTAASLPDIDFNGKSSFVGAPQSDAPLLTENESSVGAVWKHSLREDPVVRLRSNIKTLHRLREREEDERKRTEERTDVVFEKFFSRFTDSLDRHTESHLGFLRNGINWFKRESAAVLRSKKKSLVAFGMLLSFAVIPATAAL